VKAKRGDLVVKRYVLLFLTAVLSGCANYQPVPDDYAGPTATITDVSYRISSSTAQVFAVAEVDGQAIHNSIFATREASGYGFGLRTVIVERKVPAQPLTLKLIATHVGRAPIVDLFSQASGTFFSVEGVVTFTPEPGGSYIVRGGLLKEEKSVWLSDANSGKRVTEKIVER